MITGAIGVKDRFGDSGAPWELIKEFEVSAEHIAHKAVELMAIKKNAGVAGRARLTAHALGPVKSFCSQEYTARSGVAMGVLSQNPINSYGPAQRSGS